VDSVAVLSGLIATEYTRKKDKSFGVVPCVSVAIYKDRRIGDLHTLTPAFID
jgi:hypothetical protein